MAKRTSEAPPPDLQVIPTAEPRCPLIGIGGVELVCRPEPAGTIDSYFVDIDEIAGLTAAERRSWPVGRHVVHVLNDTVAWGIGSLSVAIGLGPLVDVLDGIGVTDLVLGRDAGLALGRRDPDGALRQDQHEAAEALLARALCARDEDCDLRHAFFIATGSAIWVWHYNFDTGAVVPPKPVRALV